MRLLGPDGRKLTQPLRDPKGGDGDRLMRNKARVEGWLHQVGLCDIRAGRSRNNWTAPPSKCLNQAMIDSLRARGIVAYVTAGQFIVADLTGENPKIRQRRPLAERYIELVEGGTA